MKRRIWTSGKKLNRLHTWQEKPGVIVCAVCGDVTGECPHLIKFNNQQSMATDIQQISRAARGNRNIRTVFTNYINNARQDRINIVEASMNQTTFQSLLSPDFVTNSPFGRGSYFGIDIRIVERGMSDNVVTFIHADGARHVVSLLSHMGYSHGLLTDMALRTAYRGRPELDDADRRGISLTQLLGVQRDGLDRNTVNDLESIDRQMYERVILENQNRTPVETIRDLGNVVREATNSVRQLNEAMHGVSVTEANQRSNL